MSEGEIGDDDFRKLWREMVFSGSAEHLRSCHDSIIQGSRSSDSIRSRLYFLHFIRKTNRISDFCFHDLTQKYLNQYSQVVDDFKGLNNYSNEALALARSKGYPNDSKKWTSIYENASLEDIKALVPKDLKEIREPTENEIQCLLQSFNKASAVSKGSDNNDDFTCTSTFSTKLNHKGPGSSFGESASSSHKPRQTTASESFLENGQQPRRGIHHRNTETTITTGLHKNKLDVPGYNQNLHDINQKRKHDAGEPLKTGSFAFKTAKEKLISDDVQKHGSKSSSFGPNRKCLGSRRTVGSGFVPPFVNKALESTNTNSNEDFPMSSDVDERLKNIDPKMVELMNNEIMDHGPPVSWEDIAGLQFAKSTIQEIVVWPLLRPDLFTGLRGPPKGILLFGPPGTGKTLIGKCIASQSKSTFFCISASSLTSKWVGEGEKLVRALFAVARCHQPAVIFIDEIDSLLTQRSDNEHESSRRIKTEFLVQLDGAATATDERLLIVGATNRPQELDEAARRRLVKRLYIPLPDEAARREIVEKLVKDQSHCLTHENLEIISKETDGYSGADMANLCKEAALGPMRDLNFADIEHIMLDQVRPINLEDFIKALKQVRASVSDKDLQLYQDWNNKYGSAKF